MPRVSVIVPTYNRCDCILETVRSALNQTCRDLEILVVDDGSSDDSAVEILRRLGPDPERAEALWRQRAASTSGTCGFGFWTSDVPLQYVYQPNRGMGTALNRGLQATHGEFIAFLQPEYLWDSHHLQHQIGFFDSNPDGWISHGRVVVGRAPAKDGKKRPRGVARMGFPAIVAGTELHASAIVIRRCCVEAHGGFDENLPSCEDYDLWIRIAAHMPIYQVPDSIVYLKRAPAPPSWSLDRYRVYALEKAFQSGHLSSEQRHRVAEELTNRCETLAEGFRKRNNTERANFYDRKKKKFELEIAKLDLSTAACPMRGERPEATVRLEENDLFPTGQL